MSCGSGYFFSFGHGSEFPLGLTRFFSHRGLGAGGELLWIWLGRRSLEGSAWLIRRASQALGPA